MSGTPKYRTSYLCRSTLLGIVFSGSVFSQRLILPPTENADSLAQISPQNSDSQVLKVYPDGTKKIVPLSALNYRDEGSTYGGPPKLSLYPGDNTMRDSSPKSISLAPIGSGSATGTAALGVSPSLVANSSSTPTAAGDPMGGGTPDPMGGSAPVDPLAGSPPAGSAPPLRTVSGKAAPLVGDSGSVQLGVWDSFFVNAGIGGSLQNELTSRRIWNGNNRQAYPYQDSWDIDGYKASGQVTGESFTFNPGFRFDTEFGYNFYEWLGLSLQTGIIYNGLESYNISGNFGNDGAGDFKFSADGNLIQVPIQLNGIFRWPGNMPLRPFLGFGLGAIWQELDVNSVYVLNSRVPGNYGRSGFQFGWNAQAGFTYAVQPGVDFCGSFKMLSACMPVIGNYQFQNSYNFSFEVGIQSRF